MIVDEFSCKGFDTYGGNKEANLIEKLMGRINKLYGGINKGRPNAEDLKHAEEFAQNLKQNLQKK